ncbi:MAG TPA: four helix bundle protein [Acidobacteriota bacterium]|nr:four helix bundle protein [Acidobacteriota bacterium]HQM64956.1 four helix bundle protein [Acidobacteriota bacterium]
MDKPHRRLAAWRQGMTLVREVYAATAGFPAAERFGLTSQARRAAVSVVANLAEGAARQSPRDYLRFLKVSAGSASELDTLLEISRQAGFLDHALWATLDTRLAEVDRLLFGLRRHLRRQLPSPNS